MKTTIEFLNTVKSRYNLPSDGRLAVKLGLTRSAISRFMSGKDYMGDETAMKAAELLNLDPAYVVACVHAERAKQAEEKRLWEHIAEAFMKHKALAAVLALLAVLPFMPGLQGDNLSLSASALLLGFTGGNPLYIMSNAVYGNIWGWVCCCLGAGKANLLSHSSAERLRRTVSGFAAQTDRD